MEFYAVQFTFTNALLCVDFMKSILQTFTTTEQLTTTRINIKLNNKVFILDQEIHTVTVMILKQHTLNKRQIAISIFNMLTIAHARHIH